MAAQILANMVASVSELKANPMKVVASAQGQPIAVLNRNQPAFYCVPAAMYAQMHALMTAQRLVEQSTTASMTDWLLQHPLPTEHARSAEQIDAAILEQRLAWD